MVLGLAIKQLGQVQ